ncbi:S41 family peptidase [Edaphobacter aggregans]|uniref:S41 family peptidase n=1 Tax=Edaphobacter aggregans TaxID=570835 RepID=UPI000552C867|nr:S41 family peptidase [Edaphobacter aggregans]
MDLNKAQREALLSKIEKAVSEKFYDPAFNQGLWEQIVARNRERIVNAASTEAFEKSVADMLHELSPKTLGLLSKRTPINPRNAINASFSVQRVDDGLRWVFQDILPEGVAAQAGAKSGDILLTAIGKEMRPASQTAGEPPFEMSHEISMTVRRGSSDIQYSLRTGDPKYKDNPYSDLKALTASTLDGGIAYLRVSLFPGKIGIDFANELDRIFQGPLALLDRLIVDLRGNPGGGIGGLTLMSYLTPDRLPIGYSKNRKMAQGGIHPSTLPVFDRVPRSKLAIPGLALKFMKKTSVFLYTEAQGSKAFRGRAVILVNEHTSGAAEMLTQFAQENRLATIVGSKTSGRLVSRSATKLDAGYRLIIPVAAYVSARGNQIEGNGIEPDVAVPWSFADAGEGKDNQLAAGIEQVLR